MLLQPSTSSIFILDLQHLHRVKLHVRAAATEELLHIVGGVSEGVVGAEHVNVLRVAEPVVATTEEEEGYCYYFLLCIYIY